MPYLTRSRYRRQQAAIAAVPDIAHILPKLLPLFEVDPMFKPRVKKRKKFADRESREEGLRQEWSDSDSNDDISDLEDGGLAEPSLPVKKGTAGVRPTHYEVKNWKGETEFVVYGSEEMKRAVAAKRARRKYRERTRGVGRPKARQTWREYEGPRRTRDAKGRWNKGSNSAQPVQPVQPAEDENGSGDDIEDEIEYKNEMEEETAEGYESEDLYEA